MLDVRGDESLVLRLRLARRIEYRNPTVQFGRRSGAAQLIQIKRLHKSLLRRQTGEGRGAVRRVRGGDGADAGGAGDVGGRRARN